MANTKVTQHVIADDAITTAMITDGNVTVAKLPSTVDLSSKTLTIPAITIPSASTATTQSQSDGSTKIATTAYVDTAITNLIDSAPGTLNTLNELAAALNDDANFNTTISNSVAAKLPLAGGTMTGDLILGDSVKLEVGSASGGDLQIYHDGSNSYIDDAGDGNLLIRGSEVVLGNDAKKGVRVIADGAVQLRHNDTTMLETAATGVNLSGTGALKIPVGTTAQRPTAATGQLRWNSTDGALEVYNGSAWTAVGTGSSNKVLDTFTGDGSTTDFTLTVTPANEDALMVFIDGVYQEKGDYVLTNAVLALDTAPASGEKIACHITTASVHDGTSAVNQQFTATSGQTAFTLSAAPGSENNTQVYINGVYQQKTDYTVSGTTLTFDTGLTVGDILEVNSFTVATLGNTDTVSEGSSNLYHTTARARSAISVSGNAISYNSSTGVLTANFEEGPVFTGNAQVNGTLAIGTTPSNVIGVYSSKSLANGLAAELSNTESSTGSGLVVKGGNNSSTYSADFRDYNSNSLMRIRGDGKVGIGETSPQGTLHVKSADSGATADSGADELVVEGSSNAGISILSGASASGSIYFGDSGSAYDGYIQYDQTNRKFNFVTATSGGMTLDSSNHLGIGTTSPIATLHVETATNSPGLFKSTYSGGGYVEYKLGASGANLGYLGSASQLISGGSATQLGIRSQGDVTIATGGNTERFKIESSGHFHGQVLNNSNSNPLGSGTNSGKLWSTSGNWINVWYVGNDTLGIRYFYEMDIQGLYGYTSYGEVYKDRSGRWHIVKHRSAGTDIQISSDNNYMQVNQNSGANQTNSAGNFTLVRAPGTT